MERNRISTFLYYNGEILAECDEESMPVKYNDEYDAAGNTRAAGINDNNSNVNGSGKGIKDGSNTTELKEFYKGIAKLSRRISTNNEWNHD